MIATVTVGNWLQTNSQLLYKVGIGTARLDCLVMLEDVLKKDRSWILAHPETVPNTPQLEQLNNYVTQRSDHAPLAYIRGKAAFFGRYFAVNTHVLVPRPETETMIELLQKITFSVPVIRIADVGTGSGCIGITAALQTPNSTIDFYDISEQALAVAKQNAATYKVSGHFYKSNLLANFHGPYDVILANLPYVPDGYPINQAAAFEPRLALFSGNDGLDHYQVFWQQLSALRTKPAHILTEAFPMQQNTLECLADAAGYTLLKSEGFIQYFMLSRTVKKSVSTR